METLLKPGDMIRIRNDIEAGKSYAMWHDETIKNGWLEDDMLPAGTLVKIVDISDNQYVVNAVDVKRSKSFSDDEFWSYTDQMFDPDMLCLLLEDRYDF